ncbi:hypothetical protein L2E82_10526 [Cichorium intybus]|uniref:Uncharacterized protein n=1 Tax=Cichorium intybus TaxID=13427 RepID=A0ACB9GAX8_CICIN|nr:hypothetical protein L2E82_10526 [Cichorium intybus]
MKLVPVTMCTESDGLGLRKSSECCMLVKPKQLNFDEMDGCDSSKVSSLVSKKRKLDGLLGQELAMENVVSSQSNGTFFEEQLPEANVHDDFDDECAKDETMNIGLDMNENPADKGEENTGGVSIPNSSLTKEEGRRTSHRDLGSSKSKEFEVGTNSKLSNFVKFRL